MSEYNICTNFLEIVAGTNNTISKEYREAAKNVNETNTKAMGYIKNFITSIESLASKDVVKDQRISGTKGNITSFAGYDNIKTAMEFLSKNLGKIDIVKNLDVIYESLKKYQPQYTEAYDKNVRLIVLEYESALYLLVTGLAMTMAEQIDIVQNGVQIKIQKKLTSKNGPTVKSISEFAKQLSDKNHKEYLEELLKEREELPVKADITESVTMMESVISDTTELIDSIINNIGRITAAGRRVVHAIKNSIFGIVPLIRTVLYLRYKKKADTILALDQQVAFINMNIEQLENMSKMDPKKKAEIIQRQKAIAEGYKKKAAKLRAELTEGERDAADAIKKEDPEIKKVDDQDFVLEGGLSVKNIFGNHENMNEAWIGNYDYSRSSGNNDVDAGGRLLLKQARRSGHGPGLESRPNTNTKQGMLAEYDRKYKEYVDYHKKAGDPIQSKTEWMKDMVSPDSPFYPGNEKKLAKLKDDFSNFVSVCDMDS